MHRIGCTGGWLQVWVQVRALRAFLMTLSRRILFSSTSIVSQKRRVRCKTPYVRLSEHGSGISCVSYSKRSSVPFLTWWGWVRERYSRYTAGYHQVYIPEGWGWPGYYYCTVGKGFLCLNILRDDLNWDVWSHQILVPEVANKAGLKDLN